MICLKCGQWHEELGGRCRSCKDETLAIQAKIDSGEPLKGEPSK